MGETWGTPVLSNLDYMLSTATGNMEHSRDAQLVDDIDKRGGVALTINWG